MSAVTLSISGADLRTALRHQYQRLLGVPLGRRLLVGFGGVTAAAGVCLVAGLPPAAGLLVWLLAVSVVTDLLWRRIFNWILGPALATVALVQLLGLWHPALVARTALPDIRTAVAGFGLCFGLMLILWLTFQGGEGDVKLIALLGAILGPWGGIEVAAGGYLLAAVVALGILGVRLGRRVAGGRDPHRQLTAGSLPMAPFFALAAVLLRPALGGV